MKSEPLRFLLPTYAPQVMMLEMWLSEKAGRAVHIAGHESVDGGGGLSDLSMSPAR